VETMELPKADPTTRSGRRATSLGRRAVIYVRVSDEGGRGDRMISPELQLEKSEAKCRERGLDVVDVVYDIDVSAKQGAPRPNFDATVERVALGEADVVVAAYMSRISRGGLDTARILDRLESSTPERRALGLGPGRLVTCDIDVDTSTPQGRAMRGFFSVLAVLELELIEENWTAAKINAVAKGKKLSTKAPYGYRFDESHRLVVVDDEAAVVRELFARRAAGASWSSLGRYFAEATGRRPLAPATLAGMIENRSYLGHVIVAGADVQLENLEAHAAIVELDVFEAAQRPSADWKAGRPTKAAGATTLLAGIARCATCGGKMGGSSAGGGKRVYRCTDVHCPARVSILQADLDERVERELLEWAAPVADELVDVELGETDAIAERRVELQRRRMDAELGLETFVTSELGLEPAVFAAGVKARQNLIADLEAQEAELGEASELEVVRTTLRAAWPSLDIAERRRLLNVAIAELVVTRGVRGHRTDRVRLTFGLRIEHAPELAQ